MIELENVSYKYKSGKVGLKNIDLKIEKGKITVIIGKNGSGKSTLGNLISHIYYPTKGKITVDGKILNNIAVRKKISAVFQNPNNQIIFSKVYDDMAFAINNLKLDNVDERIKKSLKLVDMQDYIDKNPFELSLGQKQRIAIASAIAINPEYIILDEATSMIDVSGKKSIYKTIKKLKDKNVGIIMITNTMEEILLADKLILIENGQIVDTLEKNEIIDNIEQLKKIGLEIPFIIKMILKLKEKGINKYSEEELLDFIDSI